MDDCKRYEDFLDRSLQVVSRMNKTTPPIAVGYTSDLDVVLEWNQEVFDSLISKHLKSEPSFEEGEKIDSLEDLARIMAYFMISGLGGEMEISSPDICNWLVGNFKSIKALGGTGAQCCAALGTIGYPAVVHISDKCDEVCQFLDFPSIVTVKDGQLYNLPSVSTEEMPVYHFICQYDKGLTVEINGKTFSAPVSNRLILDFDTVHKRFLPDVEYISYIEEHAKEIRVLSISGFNAMVDPETAKHDLGALVKHFSRLKAMNPDIMIYLESAHYFSCKVRDIVFEMLEQYVDFLGMNEEEVMAYAELEGLHTDKNDFDSILEGLELVRQKYPVRGIILHTKDYSAYYGKTLSVDIELGLAAGNLLSGTRARVGHYGSLQECRESLQYGFSAIGRKFQEKAEAFKSDDPEVQLTIVPSRYLEKPKCTIGLGDTFVAGVLTCFM